MYILAVSGGPDSMAMLDMYRRKTQAICVVNYKKRPDSDKDVACAVNYCKIHNIKYYVLDVTQKIYEKYSDDTNFQSMARKIRYDFFLEICKKEKNMKLMIAHNLNDHLETAYMQMQRNSKTLFFGIKKKTMHGEMKIFRPLINLQKSTLERHCKTADVEYAIDSSNSQDYYERNRTRKIIQMWDQEKLLNFINQVNKMNKKNTKIEKKKNTIFSKWEKKKFELNFYQKQDEKIKYYLIYDFLKIYDEKNKSKNKIESIIEFLNNNKNCGEYRLENDKKLKIKNDSLIIQINNL
ncbi:MAG: tRNA lysidine(34) synthetase TilS [Mycoplasma sp.]